MDLVISDSSTLIHLANIGRLDLLRQFFGEIVVPPAVWLETVDQGAGRSGAKDIQIAGSSGWIMIESPVDKAFVRALKREKIYKCIEARFG